MFFPAAVALNSIFFPVIESFFVLFNHDIVQFKCCLCYRAEVLSIFHCPKLVALRAIFDELGAIFDNILYGNDVIWIQKIVVLDIELLLLSTSISSCVLELCFGASFCRPSNVSALGRFILSIYYFSHLLSFWLVTRYFLIYPIIDLNVFISVVRRSCFILLVSTRVSAP